MVESLADQTIGIAFNPANLLVSDCYSEDAIAVCASRTLVVTARDAVRDLARRRGMDVPLGRGSIDFPQILGRLEQQHYSGWYIVDRPDSEQPIEDIGNAIQFLRAL